MPVFKQTKSNVVTALFITVFLMQGCATQSQKETSSSKELKSLTNDIVEMVNVDKKQQPNTNNSIIKDADNHPNAYLTGQAKTTVLPESKQNFQAAISLMQAKKWLKAEQLLNKVIAKQPELSGSYVNKALIAMHKKSYQQANKLLNQALLVNPNNPYAYNLQGQIARIQGKIILAEKNYRKALTIWPQYSQAQLNMAILLELYRGQLVAARSYYHAYLQTKPDDKKVQRWLASLEIKMKRTGLSLTTNNELPPKKSTDKVVNDNSPTNTELSR